MLFCGPAALMLLAGVALEATAAGLKDDYHDGCGNPEIQPDIGINSTVNIVGGKEAIPHSWPWMVGLHFVEDLDTGEYVFKCGGTLVGKRWVLTTAACIGSYDHDLDRYRWLVTVASHDLSGDTRTVRVQGMFKHPDFESVVGGNDIALVQLEIELEYFTNIIPLCLPKADVEPRIGTICVTTGWGDSDKTSYSWTTNKLQEIALPIAPRRTCNDAYGWGYLVPNNTICAGYFDTDQMGPCRADKGGPLACQNPAGIWQLLGIASMTQDCSKAKASRPTVYTRVDHSLGWIADVILSTPCEN